MNMKIKETDKFGEITSGRTIIFFKEASERAKKKLKSPKQANWTKAFFEIHQDEPLRKRQALSFAYALKNEPVCIFDDELLTGQIYHGIYGSSSCDSGGSECDGRWKNFDANYITSERFAKEIPDLIQSSKAGISAASCAPAHIGWRWNWIVDEGVTGMFDRIHDNYEQTDDEGREFLDGMQICLGALLEWNDRHIAELEKKLSVATENKKKNILREIEICRQVPLKGARNFHEAVQAFHFSYIATMFENPHGGNGPGRLDYFLWPYLEKDLKTGLQTPESARELVDELFIRFHERLRFEADGHVETIVVGGCHPDGSHSVNLLSEIMVESIAGLKISHPSVYMRMPQNAPESFYALASKDLCKGGNRAQIVNDESIIQAMTRDGHISIEDARMYMCGGCMEISPHGMNGDLLFTGFFNVLKVLEYVLTGGYCLLKKEQSFKHLEHSLADFANFEELYFAFEKELERNLTLSFKSIDITCEGFAKHRPRFLVSSQVEDCIAKGRGINNGGARYEDYGSTPLGIPNVGDSIYAVKKAVFDEKFVTGKELAEALENNFEGCEPLRQRLLSLPKYGQGDPDADKMTNRIINTVCNIYDSYVNRLGGKVKPMIMTFMMAPIMGAAVGATPDGRKSGLPVAQGVTPQSSSMTKGLTTAMLSATSLDLVRFSGGVSNMWDLDANFATTENVKALLKAFIQSGGQMFQGNTTGIRDLLDSQIKPEAHESLMVRIGGYSGKFTTLQKSIQDEIIKRRRHSAP